MALLFAAVLGCLVLHWCAQPGQADRTTHMQECEGMVIPVDVSLQGVIMRIADNAKGHYYIIKVLP
jgi:hypothetical protein